MSDLPLLRFGFDGPRVRAVLSTRHGGTSSGVYAELNLGDHVGDDPQAVRANRERLAAALDVEAITFADQQHLATCAVVTGELAGKGFAGVAESRAFLPATDALVTDRPGVALGILVADCAPVLLWDARHGAIGAAHAGRSGVVHGVLTAVVTTMAEQFGTDPAELSVGIGPCIGTASYEVGDREADALDARYPGAGLTESTRPGHRRLDLGRAVERQLAEAGVPPSGIERLAVDTRTSTDTFFSDRAARPCGRFAAVIALP